jgi:type IV pilus assembly protein PilV
MTLIEVLVALLVLSIGILGAAIVQLNALKQTDSAMRSSQASFVVNDLFERVRANSDVDYGLGSLSQAPSSGNLNNPRDQDLFDFADQLRRMLGDDVEATVVHADARLRVAVDWNDSRAQGEGAVRRTLTLDSLIRPARSAGP